MTTVLVQHRGCQAVTSGTGRDRSLSARYFGLIFVVKTSKRHDAQFVVNIFWYIQQKSQNT